MIAIGLERIEIVDIPIRVFESYGHARRSIVERVRQRHRLSRVASIR